MSDALLYTLPFLFPVLFVGFWLLITRLIALGAWSRLAAYFRADNVRHLTPATRSFRMRRVVLRRGGVPASYKGAITIGCGPAGLEMSVIFLFRYGHPPLLVPWSAIGPITAESSFFGLNRYYRLFISLPDGSGGVEMQFADQDLVAEIERYQQLNQLGR